MTGLRADDTPDKSDASLLSQEDPRERLADVVTQISSLSIQIEELIDVTAHGYNGRDITDNRRILIDKRMHLYREERMLRRHLREFNSERNEELNKRLQDAERKIYELNERLKKANDLTRAELRDLQILRSKTSKTLKDAYQDGLTRGSWENDRLVAILHAVATGDAKVTAAVTKCFASVKRTLPEIVIDETGSFVVPRDPNLL